MGVHVCTLIFTILNRRHCHSLLALAQKKIGTRRKATYMCAYTCMSVCIGFEYVYVCIKKKTWPKRQEKVGCCQRNCGMESSQTARSNRKWFCFFFCLLSGWHKENCFHHWRQSRQAFRNLWDRDRRSGKCVVVNLITGAWCLSAYRCGWAGQDGVAPKERGPRWASRREGREDPAAKKNTMTTPCLKGFRWVIVVM